LKGSLGGFTFVGMGHSFARDGETHHASGNQLLDMAALACPALKAYLENDK